MKKTILAFAAIVTLATVGCKKENNETEEQAVTKENVAGSYKLASVKAQVNGTSSETDITNDYMEDCERDDLLTLRADLTYANADAGVKCSPTGDESGSWKVGGSNTIEIDGQAFTVKSLTKTQMVLSVTDSYNGISATINTTLTKQ